ncbi:MAG: hypothetical protein KDA77_12190, partial [Planctomycetaceae bacterium]|nr:hypothetical protein [Planctomycetaceae bacterium]
ALLEALLRITQLLLSTAESHSGNSAKSSQNNTKRTANSKFFIKEILEISQNQVRFSSRLPDSFDYSTRGIISLT